MCGGSSVIDNWLGINPPSMPDIVAVDPVADRARAEGDAAAAAQRDRTKRKRAARASALSTGAPASADMGAPTSAMAYGKGKLGE